MSIWLLTSAGLWLFVAYQLGLIKDHPLSVIVQTTKHSFSSTAFTIMILFGYSHYMQVIGANTALIQLLAKPLEKVRYPYVLLMLLFIVASLLSVIITSAAALAVLLLGTFTPILSKVKISKLSIAAIIVSSPGIMPSPLAIETSLSAQAIGMDLPTYILNSYTMTLPMLLVMTLAHGSWQWYCDRKSNSIIEPSTQELVRYTPTIANVALASLPFLPLLLFIMASIMQLKAYQDITAIIFISLFIALILQSLAQHSIQLASQRLATFWQGMANGLIQVGSIVISAALFVEVIKQLGAIEYLQLFLLSSHFNSIILLFSIVLAILLTGIATGSGLALYFGLVPLVGEFAQLMDLSPWRLSAFLEVVAHSSRTFSSLAAVMIVTSSYLNVPLLSIVKRTTPPVVIGFIVLLLQLYFV